MTGTTLGREIREGMAKMGEGVKLAGKRKNALDIAKKGYVGFRNPNAVAMFHADPEHVDWTCKVVDGEYRFYPPESKKAEILAILDESFNVEHEKDKLDGRLQEGIDLTGINSSTVDINTKEVVETYKREVADSTKTTFVSVTTLLNDPSKCKYRLSVSDKRTGEQRIVQEFVTDFAGKFAMEVVPSLYNQMMGGLPVIDSEKGLENQRTIAFQSIDANKIMAFTNLSEAQLQLIKDMKAYVDGQYFSLDNEQKGIRK